jgi:hypothetical protein
LKRCTWQATIAIAAAACSQSPHPRRLDGRDAVSAEKKSATIGDTVVTALILGEHRVVLQSGLTLESVQLMLGRAQLIPASSHDDVDRLCYRSRSTDEAVTLESNEMGGEGRQILGFHLFAAAAAPPTLRCTVTNSFDHATTNNGLYIGMSQTALMGRMGASDTTSTSALIQFSFDQPITGKPGKTDLRPSQVGDRLGSLSATVAMGHVVALAAWLNDVY